VVYALVYSACFIIPLLLYRKLNGIPLIPKSEGPEKFPLALLLMAVTVFGGMALFCFIIRMPYSGLFNLIFVAVAFYGYLSARRGQS